MNDSKSAMPSRAVRNGWFALLALATLAVYARTLANGFVYYDDGLYVFDNVHVRNGFSFAGLSHIFVTGETGTWQPLALLSHMIDCAVFGLAPWGHHLTAIALHACDAVLMAYVLCRMTGRFYPSLTVAALFALHPAHVESVAWVSERKDVLSTTFFLLCLLAYDRFQHRKSKSGYVAILSALALGLMTKPMLVTLPCVLLLLDYWPYHKFDAFTPSLSAIARVVRKKLSLFALVAISCVVTLIVQRQNQAVVSLHNLPLSERLSNVAVSYVKYIGLLLWPSGLAIDYPHPKSSLAILQVAACCIALLSITLLAVSYRKRAPYIMVGWLWYLGTLVPVIGFVQVGEQGMADRYTYIPSIGLFIAAVWGIDAALRRINASNLLRRGVALATIALLLIYAALTWRQIGYWKSTETLWGRAVEVNPLNERALRNLAETYLEQKQFADAIRALEHAADMAPGDARIWQNMGYAQQQLGQIDVALGNYMKAYKLDASDVETCKNIGLCLLMLNRETDSIRYLQEAIRLRPWDVDAASNLGAALVRTGRAKDAVAVLKESVRIHPENARLHNNLGIALFSDGERDAAVAQFREALRLDPNFPDPQRALKALGAQ